MSPAILSSSAPRCASCGRPLTAPITGKVCVVCLLELGVAGHAAADPAGTVRLLDYVRVVNILGEGPRAHVFLAEWAIPGGGVVALKRGKESAVGRAARPDEVAMLLKLDHPGVATLFEAGVADDREPYALTEYVPGLPVTRYAERERLSVNDRAGLWLQAVDAVCYAHAHGVPHLNLKPSNVLVIGGVVKVLDFEAAMPAPGLRAAGTRDARSDIYALGLMLRDLVAIPGGAALEDVVRYATTPASDRYPTLDALAAAVRAVSLD